MEMILWRGRMGARESMDRGDVAQRLDTVT